MFSRLCLRRTAIVLACVSLFMIWNVMIHSRGGGSFPIGISTHDGVIDKVNSFHQRNILTKMNAHMTTQRVEFVKPKDDPHKLMDLDNFSYTAQQPPCDDSVQGLIIVFSAPKNLNKRTAIRKTWGNAELLSGSPLRMLFFFGLVEDAKVQADLNAENSKYNDIVQGSFVDHYRNLTYKHVMALKWYAEFCDTSQILIKADDDVYVNTPQLLEYATKEFSSKIPHKLLNASTVLFNHPTNLLFGKIFKNSKVNRRPNTKWFVTKEEYAGEYYPPYCYGQGIIYSTDVVYKLLEEAQKQKYFWVDDVLVTGILPKKINLTQTDSREYILEKGQYDKLSATGTKLYELEFIFSWHSLALKYVTEIWDLYMSQLHQKLLFKYLKSKSKER